MTPALALFDLAAFSLQLALLVGVGAVVARLLPLRPPAVAMRYWQAVLLAGLLLPFAQPWSAPRRAAPAATAVTRTAAPVVASVSTRPASLGWPSPRLLLLAVGAGVAVRAAWLAVGLFMLRGLRRRGRPLPDELQTLRQAQRQLGVRAEFFSSDETTAPITFGLRRPAVLLPASVLAMDAPAQQAIVYHELLHVRRRDWLYAVLEEAVRAVLWFHPAVAWLVGRIQLSREQAVDRAVIALTESREEYLGALLAVASAKTRPQLLPATLFLRKSRLKQRVAEILKEGTMSTRRLVSHLLTAACAVLLAAGAAVRLFPLEARAAGAPGQEGGVQVVRGGEGLLHRAEIEYPRRAIEKGVEGDVVLALSLDENGQVQDARVLSGPEELRRAALQSVLRWHYGPPTPLPGAAEVVLHFKLPSQAEREERMRELRWKEAPREPQRVSRQIEDLQKALADPGLSGERREQYENQLRERREELDGLKAALAKNEHEFHNFVYSYEPERAELELRRMKEKLAAVQLSSEDEARWKQELAGRKELAEQEATKVKVKLSADGRPLEGRLSAIHAARLGPDALKSLLPQLGVSVGDTLDSAAMGRIREAVRRFDEHLRVEVGRAPDGGLILLLVGPSD